MIRQMMGLAEIEDARKWARRHPDSDPTSQRRSTGWQFAAAAEQLRIKRVQQPLNLQFAQP